MDNLQQIRLGKQLQVMSAYLNKLQKLVNDRINQATINR